MLANNYIQAIYAGLSNQGLRSEKESLVSQYTDSRTTSVREMKKHEALDLISFLNGDKKDNRDKRGKMIRYIYSVAYNMNMTKEVEGKVKVDTERLEALTKRLSPQKKGLQAHSYKELPIFNKYYKEGLNKGGFYESANV